MPDISTVRGDSRKVVMPFFDADLDGFRLVDSDQTDNPTVNDIKEIQYVVGESPESDEAFIEKTTDEIDIEAAEDIQLISIIEAVEEGTIPADAAVFVTTLTESDTQDLPVESLWHELQIKDINNNVSTIMQGDFEVQESLSNPPL